MSAPAHSGPAASAAVIARAKQVRLVALDVDGVLTDGRLAYADDGIETKAFHTQDGQGLALLRDAGLRLAIVSGRNSAGVERRARELGFHHVHVGVKGDKWPLIEAMMAADALSALEVAYMGDDLPDLSVLARVGLASAPADAAVDVLNRVDWVSQRPGGRGAVRDLAELILLSQGLWDGVLARFLPPAAAVEFRP
jgi:3-deoxy-D-manno-octulosonate 8-phosphate phosphatase (KDO 8-P phosphatase)